MPYRDFLSPVHKQTHRDYLARVNEYPKAEAATKAKKWDYDYWDGDRNTGYGGYTYDGRWYPVAENICSTYHLNPGNKILDVGCGKAFLLYEFTRVIPGIEVFGTDISEYAIKNAKKEVQPYLEVGHARQLPYEDNSFDLVISINTLHNLYCYDLHSALAEIERVSRMHKYVCVESYRNEEEKVNLLYWQLTCEGFYTPQEWQWWFRTTGYSGDYSFIYFE